MNKLITVFLFLMLCLFATAQTTTYVKPLHLRTDSLIQIEMFEEQMLKLVNTPAVSNAEYNYFKLARKFKYSPEYKDFIFLVNGVWELNDITSGVVKTFYIDGNNYCLNCEGNVWMIAKSKNTIIISDYNFYASSFLSDEEKFEQYKNSLIFYTKDEDGKWYSDNLKVYLQRIK